MLKFIHPDLETIPSDAEEAAIHAVVEEPFVDVWLAGVKSLPGEIVVEDCEEYGFDCGGIVHGDEPTLEQKFDDWTLKVLTRHAEYLHKYCARVMTHMEDFGPHIWLPGHWVKAVLTVETGNKIKEWLDKEMPAQIAVADQWWAKHNEKMAKIGVHVPPRS